MQPCHVPHARVNLGLVAEDDQVAEPVGDPATAPNIKYGLLAMPPTTPGPARTDPKSWTENPWSGTGGTTIPAPGQKFCRGRDLFCSGGIYSTLPSEPFWRWRGEGASELMSQDLALGWNVKTEKPQVSNLQGMEFQSDRADWILAGPVWQVQASALGLGTVPGLGVQWGLWCHNLQPPGLGFQGTCTQPSRPSFGQDSGLAVLRQFLPPRPAAGQPRVEAATPYGGAVGLLLQAGAGSD